MITTVAQLDQAVEQLKRMYRALASLREELLDKDPRRFALLAEGPLEMIRQLQAQIDQYTDQSMAERLSTDDASNFQPYTPNDLAVPEVADHSPHV
jgi:hypothetical protein